MKLHEIIANSPVSFSPWAETAGPDAIKELIAPYTDELGSDREGNLTASLSAKKHGAKKLLIISSLCEADFIITGIEDGFLKFDALGDADLRTLPASDVIVLAPNPVFGVIDVLPPHVLSASDMDRVMNIESLFIDVGMSRQRAEERVPLGTPAVLVGGLDELDGSSICGKSLRGRVPAAIVVKVLENLSGAELDVDLHCIFCAGEKRVPQCAASGGQFCDADYIIAVESADAHIKGAQNGRGLKAGGGAAVCVGPCISRELSNAITDTARDCDIPHQIEVFAKSAPGLREMCIGGARAAKITLPVKYMHGPLEIIDLEDADSIVTLLTKFITRAGEVLN